jgi:SUN domain-containing protein 1/2
LEGKIVSETRKAQDLEAKARDVFSTSISGVKREVEMLQSQLTAQRKQMEKDRGVKAGPGPRVSDDEARMKLKALEERLGGVEGGVKDALEQLAKRAQAPSAPSPATGPAWWNKLAGAIKSADGQDITLLISQLVDSAVSTLSKDTIAKPDFALFSGGARVIPSLTSATLEIRPKGFTKQLRHLFSNAGYAVGRAPVTALHHELHPGQCWPFAGKEGQLGVKLAVPTVLVEEVTIDHVAKDVAYDLRTAPREMEVWGLVGGKANIERVRAWRESGAAASYDSRVVYPPTLSKHPEFILLANFTYDIHAPNHIQTFAVDPEIRALNMDFGIVVLRVLSNWGMDALTCLYRFRVHGENVGGVPAPMADEILSSREGVDSGTNEKKQGAS